MSTIYQLQDYKPCEIDVIAENGGDAEISTLLNIKTVFPRYGDSHVKDKTVVRPSYL